MSKSFWVWPMQHQLCIMWLGLLEFICKAVLVCCNISIIFVRCHRLLPTFQVFLRYRVDFDFLKTYSVFSLSHHVAIFMHIERHARILLFFYSQYVSCEWGLEKRPNWHTPSKCMGDQTALSTWLGWWAYNTTNAVGKGGTPLLVVSITSSFDWGCIASVL